MTSSNDWIKDLDESANKAHVAELVESADKDVFRDIQATLYQQSAGIVEDSLRFAEINPEDGEPPQRWVDMYGVQEARRKLVVARAAWLSSKDAPVGLQMAQKMVVGIIKAKATEEAAPRSLSVTLIQGGGAPQYPEKILDEVTKHRF